MKSSADLTSVGRRLDDAELASVRGGLGQAMPRPSPTPACASGGPIRTDCTSGFNPSNGNIDLCIDECNDV